MSRALLLVLLGVAQGAVYGRIGETEAELVKRFGPPTSKSKHSIIAQGKIWELGPALNFRDEDWRISCDLIDGRCARISYSKIGDWTEDHFKTVLNANSQGGTWSDSSNPSMKKVTREWKRSDGGTGRWTMAGSMVITVPAYFRAKSIAEAKAKAGASRPAKI